MVEPAGRQAPAVSSKTRARALARLGRDSSNAGALKRVCRVCGKRQGHQNRCAAARHLAGRSSVAFRTGTVAAQITMSVWCQRVAACMAAQIAVMEMKMH